MADPKQLKSTHKNGYLIKGFSNVIVDLMLYGLKRGFLISLLFISMILMLTSEVSANSAPIYHKEDKMVSFFLLFVSNLPLNFIYMVLFFQIFSKGRSMKISPPKFLLSIIICIVIISFIGAFTDVTMTVIPEKTDIQNDLNITISKILSNIPALIVIFLSFFIPLVFVLKQSYRNSAIIASSITIINLFSWMLLFPGTYEENSMCLFTLSIYIISIVLGILFYKWYSKNFKP